MRTIFLIAILIALAGIGTWIAITHDTSEQTVSSPSSDLEPSELTSQQQNESAEKWSGERFQLDPDRLYDKGYEADPGVQALAKAYNISPACLIGLAKYRFHEVPLQPGICPEPEDGGRFPTLQIPEDHPYHQYSNQQLESLAQTSPEAAVILARRIESDQASREMYEQAAALSGIASPLIEWMTARNTGGLLYENGKLDVDAAKVGYEIFLIAAAFDGGVDPIIETYEEELRKEGVNLNLIEQHAMQEAQELYAKRLELTGN